MTFYQVDTAVSESIERAVTNGKKPIIIGIGAITYRKCDNWWPCHLRTIKTPNGKKICTVRGLPLVPIHVEGVAIFCA